MPILPGRRVRRTLGAAVRLPDVGHVEKMRCPRGHNVNVDKSAEERVLTSYDDASRVLQEVLGEDWLALEVAYFSD